MNRQDYRSEEEYKSDLSRGWDLEDKVVRDLNQAFNIFSDFRIIKNAHDANREFKPSFMRLTSEPDAGVLYKGKLAFKAEIKVANGVSKERFFLKKTSVDALGVNDVILIHNLASRMYAVVPRSLAIELELAIDPFTTKPGYKLNREHLKALQWVTASAVQRLFEKHIKG